VVAEVWELREELFDRLVVLLCSDVVIGGCVPVGGVGVALTQQKDGRMARRG